MFPLLLQTIISNQMRLWRLRGALLVNTDDFNCCRNAGNNRLGRHSLVWKLIIPHSLKPAAEKHLSPNVLSV